MQTARLKNLTSLPLEIVECAFAEARETGQRIWISTAPPESAFRYDFHTVGEFNLLRAKLMQYDDAPEFVACARPGGVVSYQR